MTLAPAYASFTDEVLGSITPGKIADYTILSQDIMTVPLMEVLETEVYVTAMDGRPVYGSI
jgi:predicted amidohydrolase YtcJ